MNTKNKQPPRCKNTLDLCEVIDITTKRKQQIINDFLDSNSPISIMYKHSEMLKHANINNLTDIEKEFLYETLTNITQFFKH